MDASDVPVFAGTSRFAVQRQIGAGGMGVVYEVFDRERDARVALKVLPYADPSALIRFKREFRSLTSILHPNLVELYELFADGEQWFFTMEAIDGVDLLTWVRPAALDHARLRQSLRQLVRGVKAVHDAGRLHHDLKPSNVMVRPDGTVIILDFGLVTELGDRPDPHVITGTAAYMAPERWSDDPPTTASDWYSIGVMLHELLTGVTPFGPKPMDMLRAKLSMDAPRPSLSHDGIPDDLDALCADLLRRDPTARADGDEILRRLGDAVIVDEPEPGEQHLLVGRERHLHLMNEAYRRMEAGATVTAHLQGPSGTGKSTLLTRFLSAVRELPDTVVLSGRCFEQESVPYKALDSLIDALAEYLGALDDADVEPLIPVQAAVLARVFPVLQRVTAFARAPGGVSRMSDPRELRRAAVSALREMLTRIGQRRNLVLVIDDLQWGDVDSALVIGDLLQPPDPPRALLVLAYRSEYAARSACLSTLLQHEVVAEPWQTRVDIAVEPLSTAESEELARRLLSSTAGVSAADVARIAHDAGGNPYFIAELVRHVATGMRRDLPGTSDDIDLDGMLWSRVQRLPATARELLSIIAVAGQPLALGELCWIRPRRARTCRARWRDCAAKICCAAPAPCCPIRSRLITIACVSVCAIVCRAKCCAGITPDSQRHSMPPERRMPKRSRNTLKARAICCVPGATTRWPRSARPLRSRSKRRRCCIGAHCAPARASRPHNQNGSVNLVTRCPTRAVASRRRKPISPP
jgi:hypothetical protein